MEKSLPEVEKILADFDNEIQQVEQTANELYRSIISDVYLLSSQLSGLSQGRSDKFHDFIHLLMKRIEKLHGLSIVHVQAVKRFSVPIAEYLRQTTGGASSSPLASLEEQGKISSENIGRYCEYGPHGSAKRFAVIRAYTEILHHLGKGRATPQELESELRWGPRRTAEALAELIEDRRVVLESADKSEWYKIPDAFIASTDSEDALPSFIGRFSDSDVYQLVKTRGPGTAHQLANCVDLTKSVIIPALTRLTLKGLLEEFRLPTSTLSSWRLRGSVELNSFGQLSSEMFQAFAQEPMSAAEFSKRWRWDYTRVREIANLLMVKGELVRSNGRLHIVEPVRRERESRIPLDTANKNQPLIEQVFELVRTRGPATVRRLGSCTTLGDSALASALDDLVGAGRIRTDKVARHLRYYVDGEVDWTLRAKREVVQVLSAASTGATSRDIARSANWDFARIAKTLESLVAHGAVKKFRRKTPTGKTLAHYRLGKSATLADINVDNDGSNSPLDEG